MDVFWFLPTHGDGHYLGTTQGARPVTLNYLKQVAQAADSLGYHGVLIPTGRSCEDSWVIASALVPLTERLRYLVAIRPGIISPTVSARMAATLDRLSNGRLLINVVTGGDPDENRGDGIFLDHSERYEVTDEFLQIWRRVLQGESVDFEGKHLQVQNAKALYPPVQKPYPPLYFGGSSEAAHDLAAEQVDVYLTWGEPPAAVAEKIADVRERAARNGRTVKFGIRLHVIVRETAEEAWKAADKLIEHISDETSPLRRNRSRASIPKVSDAWLPCMTAVATTWKSRPTCGPASAWCAAVPGRRWSATRSKWRRESRNTRTWGSRVSSSPATRTLKKRIALPNWCSRCCPSRTPALPGAASPTSPGRLAK